MDVMNFSLRRAKLFIHHYICNNAFVLREFVPLSKAGNTGEEGSRIGLYEAAAAAASLLEVSSDDMEKCSVLKDYRSWSTKTHSSKFQRKSGVCTRCHGKVYIWKNV